MEMCNWGNGFLNASGKMSCHKQDFPVLQCSLSFCAVYIFSSPISVYIYCFMYIQTFIALCSYYYILLYYILLLHITTYYFTFFLLFTFFITTYYFSRDIEKGNISSCLVLGSCFPVSTSMLSSSSSEKPSPTQGRKQAVSAEC